MLLLSEHLRTKCGGFRSAQIFFISPVTFLSNRSLYKRNNLRRKIQRARNRFVSPSKWGFHRRLVEPLTGFIWREVTMQKRRLFYCVGIFVAVVVFTQTFSIRRTQANTFTVTTTADNGNNASPTVGSLRKAII